VISALYATIARRRRAWYDRHPDARRRLTRPVVSVGNLAVGGRGKTPAVAGLARLLAAEGERPAVLSRGYGREVVEDGVVVVRDRTRIVADLAHAGDEPLMLARQLDGVPVLVATDRHLAGVLAERAFGATVHVLDDGFQHLGLARTVDLVLLDAADLDERRTLPGGRLREPLETIARADAVAIAGDDDAVRARLAALGARRVFRLVRGLGAPRGCANGERPAALAPGARVLALAGIARPERFAEDLAAAGWTIAGTCGFRDHHRYSRADVDRVLGRAAAARAELVLTTEKDLVRLLPILPAGAPIAWVPLTVGLEPAAEFRAWLMERIRA
jgi:tetraacyldisaccharide 4'-kinase